MRMGTFHPTQRNGRDSIEFNITTEELIERLQRFVPKRYYDLNNWEIIIQRAELVEGKYYAFPCSFQTIYLDKDTYEPITYGRQHIIDGNYYYDYNEDEDGAGTYTYINSVKKKSAEELLKEINDGDYV